MYLDNLFLCDAAEIEQLVQDTQRKVRWAAEPVAPGELVKAQIRNASKNLQLDFGTVRRAWYGLSGPEIYPVIYNAWAALIERRSRVVSAPVVPLDITFNRNTGRAYSRRHRVGMVRRAG